MISEACQRVPNTQSSKKSIVNEHRKTPKNVHWTYIRKLNDTHLSKITETVVSGIFIDNQGDVLHRFRTEPTSHDESVLGGEKPLLQVVIRRSAHKIENCVNIVGDATALMSF